MKQWVMVLAFALAVGSALPCHAWSPFRRTVNVAGQQARANADAERRMDQKEKERKKQEGLRVWKLTGTLKLTGVAITFHPDKPDQSDQPAVADMFLAGRAKVAIEGLLKGETLDHLVGRRVQLAFFGEPERRGTELFFDTAGNAVREWRSATLMP